MKLIYRHEKPLSRHPFTFELDGKFFLYAVWRNTGYPFVVHTLLDMQIDRERPTVSRERWISVGSSPSVSLGETSPPSGVASKPVSTVPDVVYDEHGQTWDVYGAEFDPVILGQAIQSYLEKIMARRAMARRRLDQQRRLSVEKFTVVEAGSADDPGCLGNNGGARSRDGRRRGVLATVAESTACYQQWRSQGEIATDSDGPSLGLRDALSLFQRLATWPYCAVADSQDVIICHDLSSKFRPASIFTLFFSIERDTYDSEPAFSRDKKMLNCLKSTINFLDMRLLLSPSCCSRRVRFLRIYQ